MGFFSRLLHRDRTAKAPSAQLDHCFHCGLEIAGEVPAYVLFDEVARPMCCVGCAGIFDLMLSLGRADDYRKGENYQARSAHA